MWGFLLSEGDQDGRYCLAKLFIIMREQEDDNVIPDQGEPVDGTIDLAKELYDKLKESFRGFDNENRKVVHADNSYSRYEVSIYDDFPSHNGPKPYRMMLWVTYYPNEDKPIIPNDFIQKGIDKVIEHMFKTIPEIKDYSNDVLDQFTFDLSNDTIYFKEGILNASSLLPTSTHNVLKAKYPLPNIVRYGVKFSNLYYLEEVPKFDQTYSLAMDKIIKRVKTIYKAFSKGKWRGLDYEFTYKPTITVHQKFKRYNKEQMVLYPDFDVSISSSWPKINGKVMRDVEDQELLKEFLSELESKFKVFGINFS
jgi:hypothetical protein